MGHDTYETIDNLLAGYVSGALPLSLQVMVDAHLELSPKNKPMVASLESAAGAALDDLAPIALSNRDDRLDAIFASAAVSEAPKLTESCAVMPTALRNFIGYNAEDIPWRTVMPGFREYDLDDVDGFHVSMFWIKPGRTVPAHTHEGCEISLIVDGAFVDERGRFGRGDISIADDTIDHRPTAEKDRPCIGFAVTDGALRLTGSLRQRLGDILTG